MDSITSTLSILPNNKEQIKTFSALLLNEIENGNAKPLEVLKTFKAFEKVFEAVKNDLMVSCLNEATKYGEKKFSACGIQFEIAEAGTRYNFDLCQDPEYNGIKANIETSTEALKKREAFLKALTSSIEIVDDSTGETHKIYPPVKISTTTLKPLF